MTSIVALCYDDAKLTRASLVVRNMHRALEDLNRRTSRTSRAAFAFRFPCLPVHERSSSSTSARGRVKNFVDCRRLGLRSAHEPPHNVGARVIGRGSERQRTRCRRSDSRTLSPRVVRAHTPFYLHRAMQRLYGSQRQEAVNGYLDKGAGRTGRVDSIKRLNGIRQGTYSWNEIIFQLRPVSARTVARSVNRKLHHHTCCAVSPPKPPPSALSVR